MTPPRRETKQTVTSDHDALVARVLARPGVVLLLGDVDTGKTSLARRLLREAAVAGLSGAYLDADLGQPVAAEPGVIGLVRLPAHPGGVAERLRPPAAPDARYFVGSLTATGHELALVAGTAQLLQRLRAAARADGGAGPGMPDLVVIDVPALVAGLDAQEFAFHLLRLVQPDHVVGLARGLELDPVLAVARRFSAAEVIQLGVSPDTEPKGLLERTEARRVAFAGVFGGETHRFRVRPTVFMPALPPGVPVTVLDRLVVGLEDGHGRCSGIGLIEEGARDVHLLTPVADAPDGLRLGSVRLDGDWTPHPVDLHELLRSA